MIAADAAVDRLRGALARGRRSRPRRRTTSTPRRASRWCRPRLAKGLEYDHVIVVEPADIVAAEPRGLHRLYVVLTRAVSRLSVLHAKPLPDPIT